jgi:hypothetical protein
MRKLLPSRRSRQPQAWGYKDKNIPDLAGYARSLQV